MGIIPQPFHSRTLAVALVMLCCWFRAPSAMAGDTGEVERASALERSLVKLYFYPINRLLDLHDIVHIGIAGSIGLGAEIAATEKLSFGGYYAAKEKGVAYHGHHKRVSWLDAHTWADPTLITSPVALLPGLDDRQKIHAVEHGYATASFAHKRAESEDNQKLHFRRYDNKARIQKYSFTDAEMEKENSRTMSQIDEFLHKDQEAAIRAEVVAGVVHPYVGIELYELVDCVTGFFFLDTKEDDWGAEPGPSKLRKLGRGAVNIITGVVEIPMNIYEVEKDEGGFAAVSYGTARGIWRFFIRSCVVGPWEILTFPTSTESIIEPEFAFLSESSEVSWRIKYK